MNLPILALLPWLAAAVLACLPTASRRLAAWLAGATALAVTALVMSSGPAVWPRLPVGTRLIWVTACSISDALLSVTAVASSAPVTRWPLPLRARSISAARVPKAQCSAVPKSTQLTAAR